ncbi:acyl-CoA thioesterase [Natronobiforma cellulositropha]|uniref:acyl-CoA thioesterase n=1 Tax=Natronobiforma cellulositropha TaxID=1679076 RepID=UPI0021D586D1|nr:thioesterase family protein [Natronobiforma cellulositropha]
MDDPFTVDVHVRYNDLDTYDHVNNAVYATYLEEARIAYLHEVLESDLETFTFVVADLALSFERPVTLTDDLSVALETTSLGRASLTMAYELTVGGGERVATGETTLVHVDPEEKRPASIPDDVRERVLAYEGLEA